MSTRELDTTHPKRDDKNSPGLGRISTELGRHGQDQAMWSTVPCSSQPGQMQVSATWFTRPPSAAGEKQAPVLIARASGPDEANFLVASQSIRWKYPCSSKKSKSASRRDATKTCDVASTKPSRHPDNMLTGTRLARNSQVKWMTSHVMRPLPIRCPGPPPGQQPSMQRMSRRATPSGPSQSTPAAQARHDTNQLSGKQHIEMHATPKQGST